jgi:DHA1 family multidrug resistance protein-like MFS transporter
MRNWQRTLYVMVFVQFVSAVGMSSVFPFLSLYVEELGSQTALSTEILTGLVFSVQGLTMMLAAPVWGALADRHGRKPMVVRATLGGAVLIFLMAFARSAEELVALRAVQGLVTGVLAALTALVAANVPRERTGYALGMLQVGLWGGVSLGPLIGGVVADTLGFRAAFLTTAGLLLSAGMLTWWAIEEHFEPLPQSTGGQPGFFQSWQHVLAMRGVRVTYLARFLNQLGRTMIMPFTPLFVQELMSQTSGAATLTGVITGVSALAGTFSAIYLGRLGDRVGHRPVLALTALTAALFYLPQSAVTSVWQLLILMTLAGATAGGIMPAISALLAGYTEPGEEGAVYGLESSIMSAGRAAAPLIGAGIVSWLGLRSIYATSGIIFLIMGLLAHQKLPDVEQVAARTPELTAAK